MKIPKDIKDKYASQPREFRSGVDISDLLAQLPRPNEAITADFEYFVENQEALKVRYPDRWVAILNREVVAQDPDPFKVEESLKERGLDIFAPVVEFVEKTPRNLSLRR